MLRVDVGPVIFQVLNALRHLIGNQLGIKRYPHQLMDVLNALRHLIGNQLLVDKRLFLMHFSVRYASTSFPQLEFIIKGYSFLFSSYPNKRIFLYFL